MTWNSLIRIFEYSIPLLHRLRLAQLSGPMYYVTEVHTRSTLNTKNTLNYNNLRLQSAAYMTVYEVRFQSLTYSNPRQRVWIQSTRRWVLRQDEGICNNYGRKHLQFWYALYIAPMLCPKKSAAAKCLCNLCISCYYFDDYVRSWRPIISCAVTRMYACTCNPPHTYKYI